MSRRVRRVGPLLTDFARDALAVAALALVGGFAVYASFYLR